MKEIKTPLVLDVIAQVRTEHGNSMIERDASEKQLSFQRQRIMTMMQ